MPRVSWLAYAWPNRRSQKTVVEITLDFSPADQDRFPQHADQVRSLLNKAGILTPGEPFPERALPDGRMAWYTSLLLQSALLFQRKAGHRVSFFAYRCDQEQGRCTGLLEHEHCDVGMTAVKLVVEMMNGQRKLLAEPFRLFSEFARARLLPRRTEAIIEAARHRDIPVIHLERSPYKQHDWDHLTGGNRICPNGLIMLGHGRHQKVLDGTWSLDLGENLAPVDGAADDPDIELPDGAAEQILERLFPGGGVTRMPVIAVTGTNGKTTTVLMIDWIMRHAGRKPGRVCSNGTCLDNRLVDERAACTDTGHLQVLTSKEVDIAVLETHHAGIIARGFCFDWCDIAVCTNVTNDHLGVGNIDTIEQMAELKRALPERARHAAVLNADDEHCLAMIDTMTARVLCLVSMDKDAAALQAIAGTRPACFCVLEKIDGQEWLVLHDAGERIPLLAVDQVPATFDGAARFNVSNAMHAAVSAYQAGVEPTAVAAALGQFSNDFNVTAGRMNQFEGLPFRVIMDYAHNRDGFRRLAEFVSQQSATGRKILMLNQLGDRLDADILASVAPLAGHFDHYVCRNYRVVRNRPHDEIPALLKKGLVAAGVPEAAISTVPDADEAVRYSLSLARPGDLLVLLAGNADMASTWQLLNDMAAGQDA
jgi:UDP-N-acetylmuramyl tripeptide synthase